MGEPEPYHPGGEDGGEGQRMSEPAVAEKITVGDPKGRSDDIGIGQNGANGGRRSDPLRHGGPIEPARDSHRGNDVAEDCRHGARMMGGPGCPWEMVPQQLFS